MVCSATADNKENLYSKYRKTAFGYVSQYYFLVDAARMVHHLRLNDYRQNIGWYGARLRIRTLGNRVIKRVTL